MLDVDQLVSFILDKKWLGLAVLVLMYLGRLLKDDSKFPLSFDRFRPLAIIVTSQALFIGIAVQQGTPVKNAAVTALVVAIFTMGLFPVAVKMVMGDNPWPDWLMALALVFPPETKIPPPPKGPSRLSCVLLLVGAGVFGTADEGCAQVLKEARTITGETAQCLAANPDLPDEVAFEKCGVLEAEREIARLVLSETRKQSAHAADVATKIADSKRGCGK